jgi:hypothetical protein
MRMMHCTRHCKTFSAVAIHAALVFVKKGNAEQRRELFWVEKDEREKPVFLRKLS